MPSKARDGTAPTLRRGETMQTLVLFDIGSDSLRRRVEKACRDVGMDRLQYSAFHGELDIARRAGLVKRLEALVEKHALGEDAEARSKALAIHLVPLCAADFGRLLAIGRPRRQPETQTPAGVVIV